MTETILSRAIRGLGSSLRFTGSRSGPPGIDLSRASTPVNDLTQYARYGAAQVFEKHADGWVTLGMEIAKSTATFETVSLKWDEAVSGDFGIATNSLSGMILWVYFISLQTNGAVTDVGVSRVSLTVEAGINVTGARNKHDIWLSDGNPGVQKVQVAATVLSMINLLSPPVPMPWPAGEDGLFLVQNLNANLVTWDFSMLCRMLPLGTPPLP